MSELVRPTPRRGLLESSRLVNGIFLKLSSVQVVDVIAGSSFDFAIIDREHSQLSEHEALALIARARMNRLPVLIRLPAVDAGQINRALEAGACGIQVSMVTTAAQVVAARQATRYAPQGRRSISLAHPAGGYGSRDLGEYGAEQAADPPIIVAQFETEDTEDPIEEIIAAGVDVAFIGGLDLAHAMSSDPRSRACRIASIADAAERTGTILGGAGVNESRLRYIANHTDIGVLNLGAEAALTSQGGQRAQLVPPACAATDGSRTAIEDLLTEFAFRLDQHGGAGIEDLFTVGGTLTMDDAKLQGRDEVRAGYEQRASRGARTARHLINNVRVTMLGTERANVVSSMVLYAADGEPVLTSQPPLIVADYNDVVVCEPGAGWRFESRQLTTLFRGSGPVVTPAGVS